MQTSGQWILIEEMYQEVRDSKYLGLIIRLTSDNNCERDIKVRMAAGNRCYHELTRILISKAQN
jgi:hypothetical protein